MNKDYCLNNNGILKFKGNDNYIVNKNNIELNYEENDSKEQIRNILIDLTFNLFVKNPIDFMNNYINIWCESPVNLTNKENNKNNENFYKASKDKQYKLNMIELLSNLSIPLSIILYAIKKVVSFHYEKNKDSYVKGKKKMYITSYKESIFESKLLHFIYSYLVFYNEEKIDKKELIDYWKNFISIFNIIIDNTKCSLTHCWIYEIINILIYKFNIYKILDETSLRKDIGNIFTTLTKKLSDLSFLNKFESEYQDDEYLVLPMLPSIYTEITTFQYIGENLYKKLNQNIEEQKNKLQIPTTSTLINNNIQEANLNNISNIMNQTINKEPFRDIFKNDPNSNDKSIITQFYQFLYKVCLISSEYEMIDRRLIQVPESLF